MDILIAALQDAVTSGTVIAMLMIGAVTSLLVLIAPRGARWFALVATTLLAVAHLFFGHRLVRAPPVPYGEIGDTHERCTGHAVREPHDAVRNGRGSTRQVETAR